MSLVKKLVVAVMVLIAVAIGLIIYISNRNVYDINEKLEQAADYYSMMDYDKTIAIYNSVIAKDKTCAEAYVGLASAYSAKGNDTKAIEILEQGIEATKNDKCIEDKIAEMSGVAIMKEETEISTEIITEATEPMTTAVTTVPVTETTTVPETVTTEETTVTTAETTAATTERTTVITAATTKVTTAKPTISVPNFIGITKEEAASLARSKNVKLAFEYENNDTYPNGVIYYQSNREGTLVAPSTTVYAYVCVNDTEYVSDETKALRSLKAVVKTWADSNGAGGVSIDEKNSVVTLNANSAKRFVLDESVVSAIRKCNGATLQIETSDYTMSIASSSVADVSKLDLSSDYNGNHSRASFTVSDGADSCVIKVILTNCEINSNDYENMRLYVNNQKPSVVNLTIDEEPILLISKSGTYTIK